MVELSYIITGTMSLALVSLGTVLSIILFMKYKKLDEKIYFDFAMTLLLGTTLTSCVSSTIKNTILHYYITKSDYSFSVSSGN